MGEVRTISISKGKGYVPHNVRAFTPSNADPTRTHLNRTYVHEELSAAYEFLFGDAIRSYDEKQKRPDRKIRSSACYLARMQGKDGDGSKNGEQPFYEVIVQVGDMHDCGCGTPDGDLAEKILDEYARNFQERNPRLHVIGMYLHLDEATPHLHVDFVPVADGYKTGMSVRNGLDRALRQQGVSALQNNRKSNATIAWQDQERDALEVIMQRHGLERAEHSGSDRKGLPIDQYRAMAESLQKQIEDRPIPKARKALGGVKLSAEEWKDVSSMHQLSQQLAETAKEAMDTAQKKIKEASYLRHSADAAVERVAAIEHKLPELESEVDHLKNENKYLDGTLSNMSAMSSGALISVQYAYSALTTLIKMIDPTDAVPQSIMHAVQLELGYAMDALNGEPDEPQYGSLSPVAAVIAKYLINSGGSVRFDNVAEDDTASIIADLPGDPYEIVLASGLPDFASAEELMWQIPMIRSVRTRRELISDARDILTPLLQAMQLGSDTPREQIRDMVEDVGVIPVIDIDPMLDRWNILMPRSFAPDLKRYRVIGEDVSVDRLADFWLPQYYDSVIELDRTAQILEKEKAKQKQIKKAAPTRTRTRHDDWTR